MSYVINDEFPISEIEKVLVGKKFLWQDKITNEKVYGVIAQLCIWYEFLSHKPNETSYFKPMIWIYSEDKKQYKLDEIWIGSVEPFKDYGGIIITPAVNLKKSNK